MLLGLIKWFDISKGYGVIDNAERGSFFIHKNDFAGDCIKLAKGTAVTFKFKKGRNERLDNAVNCQMVSSYEHFKIALQSLTKPDNIQVEREIRGVSRNGNPYLRKENVAISVKSNAISQLFKRIDTEKIKSYIIDYFEQELEKENFIVFCDFINERINNDISVDVREALLKSIFSFFADKIDDDTIFMLWKTNKLHHLGYTEKEDFEIPSTILSKYSSEIGTLELKRIKASSYGDELCNNILAARFSTIQNLSTDELKALYDFLEFATPEDKEKYQTAIDSHYLERVTTNIIKQANESSPVNTDNDFNNYNRLRSQIPSELGENEKANVNKELDRVLVEKCSEQYKPVLWIKGIMQEVPFEYILKTFLSSESNKDRRVAILKKLNLSEQLESLSRYSESYTSEKAFIILESLLREENSLEYSFELSEYIFDKEFWKEKKHYELINSFSNYVNENATDDEKYELFIIGLIIDVPLNVVKQNIDKLDNPDLIKIFTNHLENKKFIYEILISKILISETVEFAGIYDLANTFLDADSFNSFDAKIYITIDKFEYFKLWEKAKAKIFPQQYIEDNLSDIYENYTKIEKWINSGIISSEEIAEILLSYLCKQIPVTDRKIFYKQYNHIRYLLSSSELHLEKIARLNNDFYKIIIWFLGYQSFFDFDLLKQKFIYFSPEEQVKIIRKLFSLKANNIFELTVEKLDELTRFDLDLYRTNLNFNPSLPVDISSDVLIKALISYTQRRKFLVESELLSVVLISLKDNKSTRFKLDHYFEKCAGRKIAKFDWSREGEIKKVFFGESKFYFAITFPTGKTTWIPSRWGGREAYEANSNFDMLKAAVKKLSGHKWNPTEKHWGVPSQHETEVLDFAKEYRFYLDFEGSNYTNNRHLAEFIRVEKPNGVDFCHGRLSNKVDDIFQSEFWWCQGDKCFEKCETLHNIENWEKYTLFDFLNILELNLGGSDNFDNSIENGKYYEFIGFINRFNRLIDKLYCNSCNEILYPVDQGWFTVNSVIRFSCTNANCSEHSKIIYLNHCLNGKCESVIDSRISKKCPNEVFICENCGSCCSHSFFERRLKAIDINDFLDNPKKMWAYNQTKRKFEDKLGHLERAEYFCHKCGNKMDETEVDIFYCNNCEVKYDTTKFRFKRPHKYLRTTNTTNTSDNLDIDDLLF